MQRGFGCETPDGRRTKRGRLAGKAAGNRIGKNYSAFSR
ncbi:hypothetical protein BURCENBC7_AP7869 [Burkholderia cenocepacia BC7]|nr:hypothetical protein BURCENBC7_AP7869 [Burkholderia cenocepacia BC7]